LGLPAAPDNRGKDRVFRIELTRGPSWQEPVETIDCRDCDTESIEFAAAEARFWLTEIQRNAPARGATHYRVLAEGGTVIGGPL